jgi:hypothetical protein
MSEHVTLQDAEQLRKLLGLNDYEFSSRLGFSHSTYRMAKFKGKLSTWMQREIALRYGRMLAEVRR